MVDVGWQDLLDLHVVRKLRQIVRRRFAVEIAVASTSGERIDGPPDAGPCARAARAASSGLRTATYSCPAHGRRELACPVVIDGELHGSVLAPLPGTGGEDFLVELVELMAEEMVAF